MKIFQVFLYNVSLRLYRLSISISSIQNNKAKNWIRGRKKWHQQLKQQLQPDEKRIWIHCASLGEFEQGRPVIESIRKNYPEYKIVLTFFSPSGYEIRKNYEQADYIFYLPLDTKGNATKFIELVDPQITIFIKYEFWYHYIDILHKKKKPLFLISAIFREDQVFFKWYGGLFLDILRKFTHIFVQDKNSLKLLQNHDLQNVSLAFDTRFDRVSEIAANARQITEVETFLNNKKSIIAGSTWPEDEELLVTFINNNPATKYIIAPHEIDVEQIEQLREKIDRPVVLFSETKDKDEPVSSKDAELLIIDNIGMLASLYKYGYISYVGGGFGEGIHNTLEPAVYGIPVVFGPNYHKFKEAEDLIAAGAAFAVNNYDELQTLLFRLLNNKEVYQKSSAAANAYIKNHRGGTDTIMAYLKEYFI